MRWDWREEGGSFSSFAKGIEKGIRRADDGLGSIDDEASIATRMVKSEMYRILMFCIVC